MNEINIKPYKSVGNFHFGKTQKEIITQFGEASKVEIDNIMQRITEFRNAQELIYDKKGNDYILNQVICLKDTTPMIENRDIFSLGLEKLKEIDNDFVEGKQYTTFRTLGICLGGFGKKKIPEKRLLIAFSREKLAFYEDFTIV
ncbi:CTP synthase [Capnocytophaga stomatis]|nr:CTP synthase [Capnocytophaga stomatis]